MNIAIVRIASVVAAAALASGCASINPMLPTHQFLERTSVVRTPSDTSLMYEALAATHVMLWDQSADALNAVATDGLVQNANAWRLTLTPMFRIRQLKDSSAAVRTPSFMPRISLDYVSIHRGWPPFAGQRPAKQRDAARPAKPNTNASGGTALQPIPPNGSGPGSPKLPNIPVLHVSGVRLLLTHHSNGQAGCFREGFEPVDSRANDCRPIVGADTNMIRINRANGDFSTTFASVLLHHTTTRRRNTDVPWLLVGGALGADWHLPSGVPGALSSEQRELYGSYRLRAIGEVGRHSRLGISRISAEVERAPAIDAALQRRLLHPVPRGRWSIEVSHSFDALLGAGPLLRWSGGQDNMNIGFVNDRKVFSFGVVLDASGRRMGAKIY